MIGLLSNSQIYRIDVELFKGIIAIELSLIYRAIIYVGSMSNSHLQKIDIGLIPITIVYIISKPTI
jgi:hypothetical protein